MFEKLKELVTDAPIHTCGIIFVSLLCIQAIFGSVSYDTYWLALIILISAWLIAESINNLEVIGICLDDVELYEFEEDEDEEEEEEFIQNSDKKKDQKQAVG